MASDGTKSDQLRTLKQNVQSHIYLISSHMEQNKECQIWAQSGSDFHQKGKIRDFFRLDFSTFSPAEKVTDLSLLVPI